MKSLLAALVGALVFVAPALGAGTVEYGLSAESPTLGHPIPYALYKPFPFPAEGERWPVIYLLHGVTGKDGDWFTWGNLGPILDQAIADGRIPPMVVVAPGFGDSWYADNPDAGGFGLVETALATDFIAAIDKSLPTARCPQGRAIGGLSMGGYGAMLQGLDHPDLYAAAISFSGALHMPLETNDPRRPWIVGAFRNVYGTPFDPQRFNAGTPYSHIGQLRGAKVKPAFYLTIGDNDYPDLIEASAAFHNRLRLFGADTTLRIGPGHHYWDTWQQAIVPALEWLAPRLDAKCGRF
ncbi:MAG: alpha/beta hydrolase family protein [Devosia sp.]